MSTMLPKFSLRASLSFSMPFGTVSQVAKGTVALRLDAPIPDIKKVARHAIARIFCFGGVAGFGVQRLCRGAGRAPSNVMLCGSILCREV
jgi:hypothetical protein